MYLKYCSSYRSSVFYKIIVIVGFLFFVFLVWSLNLLYFIYT